MFESPVAFLPGLRLLPAPTIRAGIGKQISNVFGQGGLIVFGHEHIVASSPMDLRTAGSLGMHRIQTQNAPLDQGRRKQRFEGTDLILLLPDVAVPQDDPGCHVIATEQMNGMGLFAGGSHRFAINGKLGMIEIALTGLKAAGFTATALLGFEAA